jgi:hypothetical protein
MNKFIVKCKTCGLEHSFEDMKSAYLAGWNFGSNAECFDCQKSSKEGTILDAPMVELLSFE